MTKKSGKTIQFPKQRKGDVEPYNKLRHTYKSGLETNLHSLSLASD
jgi:hypothetical protein